MTMRLDPGARLSKTAQSCILYAACDDDDDARSLLKRIERRQTDSAQREAKILRRMLDYSYIEYEMFSAYNSVDCAIEEIKKWKSRALKAEEELAKPLLQRFAESMKMKMKRKGPGVAAPRPNNGSRG